MLYIRLAYSNYVVWYYLFQILLHLSLYDNVTKYVTDVISLSCFVILYHYLSTKSKLETKNKRNKVHYLWFSQVELNFISIYTARDLEIPMVSENTARYSRY